MQSNTTTSICGLFALATLGTSSVVTFNEDLYPVPTDQTEQTEYSLRIEDWKDRAFNVPEGYIFFDADSERFNTLVSFTKNLISNSKDIDSEFVDIVNENFWELI